MAIAVLGLAIAASVAAVALGRQAHQVDEGIRSVALSGTAHALVVLPDGYATSRKRYPVIYFLHGLPAGPDAYRNSAWLAETLERVGPAILVMPQGARTGDPDAEYLNWGAGRNWETFIAEELPAAIDKRFRTIRSRRGRALIGLSAGGFGATVLGPAPPRSFLGRRVLVRVLPSHRSDRNACARPRAADERAQSDLHPEGG